VTINEFRWGVKPAIPGHWCGTFKHENFDVEITSDWVEARTEDDGHIEAQRARAEEIVSGVLRKIGLSESARFTASFGSQSQFDSSANRRDINVFLSEGVSARMSAHADVVVTASDGTVISDSRAERFSDLFQFSDDSTTSVTLRRLTDYLLEYHADKEKKLAPLFDIIELAKEVFGTEKDAAAALGIPSSRFRDSRRVINDKTLQKGRHRGQELGTLREPTRAELELCETLAEQIVIEYTKLVRSGTAPS
jgi:hypothetical protein